MKVGELRTMAKNAPPDAMLSALTEAYKKVPKDKKDELDQSLAAIFSAAAGKPIPVPESKPKVPAVNLDRLEAEVEKFTDNAYDGNYYYSNNKVTKANRPKWRFKVMDFLKTMDDIPTDHPEYARVAELYITLYKVLSHGHVEHMFHGDEPFRSISYEQTALLERMVSANLAVDDSPETLYELIHAICRGCPSPEIYHLDLQECLLSFLDTEERRETALEQAMQLSEEYIGRLGKERSFSTWMITSESIEDNRCAENLSEMVLQIAYDISPERYLSCLDFYYEHCYERDHEIALYRALRIPYRSLYHAEEAGLDAAVSKKAWVDTYEDALKRGIQPREELQKQYAKYKG